MKYLLILLLTGCTVKGAIEGQYKLKNECMDLKPELDALGSKQLPAVVEKKVQACKEHGFWPKQKRTKLYKPGVSTDL